MCALSATIRRNTHLGNQQLDSHIPKSSSIIMTDHRLPAATGALIDAR
jgi:hypothetical protein